MPIVTIKTYKQTMTFPEKGQIFILVESGKSLTEISEITNFSVNRLFNLVDGLKGTNAWNDAKTAYVEGDIYNGNGTFEQDFGQEHSSDRLKPNKKADLTRSTKDLSKRHVQGHESTSGHKQHGSQMHHNSGGTLSGPIVKTLREAKDYVGE